MDTGPLDIPQEAVDAALAEHSEGDPLPPGAAPETKEPEKVPADPTPEPETPATDEAAPEAEPEAEPAKTDEAPKGEDRRFTLEEVQAIANAAVESALKNGKAPEAKPEAKAPEIKLPRYIENLLKSEDPDQKAFGEELRDTHIAQETRIQALEQRTQQADAQALENQALAEANDFVENFEVDGKPINSEEFGAKLDEWCDANPEEAAVLKVTTVAHILYPEATRKKPTAAKDEPARNADGTFQRQPGSPRTTPAKTKPATAEKPKPGAATATDGKRGYQPGENLEQTIERGIRELGLV